MGQAISLGGWFDASAKGLSDGLGANAESIGLFFTTQKHNSNLEQSANQPKSVIQHEQAASAISRDYVASAFTTAALSREMSEQAAGLQ